MTANANVATEVLRTLHRIHRQLGDLKDRLARGPRLILAHEAHVQRVEKELGEVTVKATALRVATDEKQLQLSTSEASIEKRQLQLRAASSNTEYQALRDQIAATKAANEVLEIEILEAMEKLDVVAERVAQSKAELAAAKRDLEKVRQEVETQKPVIEADVRRLEAELAECESALPGEFREQYNRVVRSRGQDALAAIEGEYCGGCNQHVPVNLINQLMLARPAACRSCGRLLYLPEDTSPV